ncbi:myosin-binding protein 2 [Senna tora]|uniref:Myosin-binding protein 2 n=1 Tax=Senna tora TaxID=362788 RepID=A0A834STM4_9FABA|nr:myosin-binding protein 2 [Senna tora]
MLHRNTNKITRVLIYAILEWILIVLLLLNSLFSYLILKFADYFGLKRPCVWCTRIDHIIEPGRSKYSCRDLVCDAHASEISKLGFCLNHRRLAESEDMCEDCSSSSQPDYIKLSKSFGFFPWMKQIGMVDDRQDADGVEIEDEKESLRCSCCGVGLDSRFYPPCLLIKPSLGVLDYTQKQNLMTEGEVDAAIDKDDRSDRSRSDFVVDHHEDGLSTEENKDSRMVSEVDEVSGRREEEADENCACSVCENAKEIVDDEDYKLDLEAQPFIENWHTLGDTEAVFSAHENTGVSNVNGLESIEVRITEGSSGLREEKGSLEQEDSANVDNVEPNMERREEETCADVSLASEEAAQMQGDEFEADVSIGTEIPEHELVDEYQSQDILLDTNENDGGQDKSEEEFVEFRTMVIEARIPAEKHHLSSSLELNENEDEKVPDTPTSVEGMHQLHKKLLLLERKESGTEDSLDGSVISDIDCGELTVEKLKSALKSERKTLSVLYAELEEERSASAIAANQTMAMINRLQEEKAAMQMEALQYQRMMEEQSEYDQEALQLLNELMVKREKEKQELEKELEVYRRKVLEYEIRERTAMSRRDSSIRSRTSSASCSNAEDSDGLSIDLNHEAKEENGFYSHQESSSSQNTPVDGVIYLEASLANFEEERVSILEQLKLLEEKLVMLNYEEEQNFDDIKSSEHLCVENGNGFHDHDDYRDQINGFANGHSKEINGKHHQVRKIMGPKAKRLLPLFDAIDTEAEDGVLNGDENGLHVDSFQNGSAEKFELEKEKLAMEEEMDQVYERLQALEADREFLKHCISSLRKGDKGLDLLQEILQHLRDLRNVDLRVRNMSDLPS